MGVYENVYEEILNQNKAGNRMSPYTISRGLGYRLSGRISRFLNRLEDEGKITRNYFSGNDCEIKLSPPQAQEE